MHWLLTTAFCPLPLTFCFSISVRWGSGPSSIDLSPILVATTVVMSCGMDIGTHHDGTTTAPQRHHDATVPF